MRAFLKPRNASSPPRLPQTRMISNCLSLLNGMASLNAGINELNDHAVSFNVEASVFSLSGGSEKVAYSTRRSKIPIEWDLSKALWDVSPLPCGNVLRYCKMTA